ncbi:sugar-binding domain-containing protein [Caldithrix abyssi]
MPLLAGWSPGAAPLMTTWGEQLNPDSVLDAYPRPQMVRSAWLNLNGLWQFQLASSLDHPPFNQTLNDTILVPFPIESALSGVMQPTDYAWYRRLLTVPEDWKGKRILLHFGAIDWQSKIYFNQQLVAEHKGGYDAFTVDVTDVWQFDAPNELIVGVYDPTNKGGQPVGKQNEQPQSIWFTAVTGIWQTVWLEAVPQVYIKNVLLLPDIDRQQLTITITLNADSSATQVVATAMADSQTVGSAQRYGSGQLILPVVNPHLWSPEDPFLYDLQIRTQTVSGQNDTVQSYFAMRKISLKQDEHSRARIALNNHIYFQIGPLDQGYWPDGLYTAPSDEALKYDIEMAKKLGFNFIRKHVKVEPERWYYWCDKLGMLVWQDMPNAANRTLSDREQFKQELGAMVRQLYNHPSIVVWVVFNENWGKFETQQMVDLVRQIDDSRLINANSGWNINGYDEGAGDINDVHHYPEPRAPQPEYNRAIVCGEYGGLWREVKGHTWAPYTGTGFASGNALATQYIALTDSVQNLIKSAGLSAAVYTEISDVEAEYAGLLTYDRKVLKCYYLPIYLANTRTVTTTIEQTVLQKATSFRLLPNFPNPFNDQTTIPFEMPRPGLVRLEVFTISGQCVFSAEKWVKKAGLSQFMVDLKQSASGIYFYRLKGGNRSAVRKMILVK